MKSKWYHPLQGFKAIKKGADMSDNNSVRGHHHYAERNLNMDVEDWREKHWKCRNRAREQKMTTVIKLYVPVCLLKSDTIVGLIPRIIYMYRLSGWQQLLQ